MEDVLEITNQEFASRSKCAVHGVRILEQINRGDIVFFTAEGEGLDNETPKLEDVRWIPHSFQVGNYLRYFMFSFTESFMVTKPGEHIFSVRFHKEYYDGFSWMPTKEYKEMAFPILVI